LELGGGKKNAKDAEGCAKDAVLSRVCAQKQR